MPISQSTGEGEFMLLLDGNTYWIHDKDCKSVKAHTPESQEPGKKIKNKMNQNGAILIILKCSQRGNDCTEKNCDETG